MSCRRTVAACVVVFAAFAAFSTRAHGQDAGAAPPAIGARPGTVPSSVQITRGAEITPVGDVRSRLRVAFGAAEFARIRAATPDPRRLLQDFAPARTDMQIAPGAAAVYDDAASAVVVDMTQLGGARNRGDGRWELDIEPGMQLVGIADAAGRTTAQFHDAGKTENGATYESRLGYALPAGATLPAFDAATRTLTWTLPFAGGTGEARIAEPQVHVKDRLMATVYKVYGLGADFAPQWVAKTVWTNAGTNVARNLKVRYRLEGYSEWSPWDKFPELVPGETVVSVCYPVLQASIAKIRTNTPADLRLEWRWEDADGKAHEDDASRRITLLGVNEFIFTSLTADESDGSWQDSFNNAPLLAAWVSRNDPVIKQFAAMANRRAGGVGATTDDASAVRVLQACYDLLRVNDFTYQHPPALTDRQVSFDVQAVQNVKFPRDVVRDRSGTCIDLAILYASMANAVGLDPYLALIPGHCFPFVKLPGGRPYAVEATGVGGGVRYGSLDFERAAAAGNKELADAFADGRVQVVKVREDWTRGISNPELDEYPADILEKWGIGEDGRRTPGTPGTQETPPDGGTRPGRETPPGPDPGRATPPAAVDVDGLAGSWGGSVGKADVGGGVTLDEVRVEVARDAAGAWTADVKMTMTLPDGGGTAMAVDVHHTGGAVDGDAVKFEKAPWHRSDPVTGQGDDVDGHPLVLRLADGKLKGTFEGEGGITFTLSRNRR